jgi:hypothetical protein
MKFSVSAIVLVVVAVAALAGAVAEGMPTTSTRTTYLTFSGPFRLPGVTLPAGTYIFERVDSQSRIDLVRVLARDRSRVYLTAFTNLVERPAHGPMETLVTFGEVGAGTPAPVKTWFPYGERTGHQFVY